ncbi:unnamed protein product [Sphagnum jensenii]|uniref:Bacterial Ig-like domain-containing protein n=1 Tax=Sphagnum jensenii TaxID=128206 RepID=A0ABP1ALZ5_9BRYO
MGTYRVLEACWSTVVVYLLCAPIILVVQGAQRAALSIAFTETPPPITSRTSATFRFDILGANGSDPCGQLHCSIQCKLDQGHFQDCLSRQDSYVNLENGGHVFSVAVNLSSGASAISQFSWTVDTIPPTAFVEAGQAYTDAVNVTVNITFSELCDQDGGFVCPNTSSCDLLVHGPGVVVPSTFEEIEHGLIYSVVVMLSTQVPSGKVTVVMARRPCADAAGNLFERTANSSFVIRFDRTAPSVNLWTASPDYQVTINNQSRTIQATNKVADLIIFLDFSQPITTTASELQQMLDVSSGVNLTARGRKSLGNRRFGYTLGNTSNPAVVTVSLPGNRVQSVYGALIAETTNTTFLFDTERPQVLLSTTSPAKTKSHYIPVVIQFTEPVFLFNSSGVMILGGNLTSFKEVSETTYALEVYIVDNNLMTVVVPENQAMDIAGNSNLASPVLQVRHYTVPAVSVVMYSLTTAGLLTTALASAALSVSSASLAAAGALSSRTFGSIGADPSRNLLGMASHLQVLALSDWLAVSLPTDYSETVRGLRWLIPHVKTPWQHSWTSKSDSVSGNNIVSNLPIVVQFFRRGGRRLLMQESVLTMEVSVEDKPAEEHFILSCRHQRGKVRKLWQDFERNMFWLAVVGGGLILLHILMLVFLRWRTKTSLRGALSVPRFELFVLVLALPAICQASAFTIRGGTEAGIGVGVLLLSIPASLLLSVSIFLTYGIFMGELVQYEEICNEIEVHKCHVPLTLLAGSGRPGKWFRKKGLASTFLPRYGSLFEDLKGPPKLVNLYEGNPVTSVPSLVDTEMDRAEKIRTSSSNRRTDEITVSLAHKVVGGARSAYVLVDLARRILFGVLFGVYSGSRRSWRQVIVVLAFTVLQLMYLLVLKPFRKRGVQLAESISLLSQTGIFAAALVLIARDQPLEDHTKIGIIMLVLLLSSFLAQLANVWYALMKQLLHLSSSDEPSYIEGFKKFIDGFVLPFLPHDNWSRSFTPEAKPPPDANPVPCTTAPVEEQSNQDQGRQRSLEQGSLDSPIPMFSPEPSAFLQPRSIRPVNGNDDESTSPSGEIRGEGLQRSDKQSWNQWSKQRPSEGKRSKGSIKDGQTDELKLLRELARASFSRTRKDEELNNDQGTGGAGTGGAPSPMDLSSPIASPGQRERSFASQRRQITGDSCTDDSLSNATSDGEISHEMPSSVLETSYFGDATSSSRRSIRKSNRQQIDTHSKNLPLREAIPPNRPLDER